MKKIIIGLTGLAGAGKSTAARFLSEEHGFTVLPFAGPLKRMALAYGLTPEEIGPCKELPFARKLPGIDGRIARLMLGELPFYSIRRAVENMHDDPSLGLTGWFNTHRDEFTTPRRFLQLLGTEWGRQVIGEPFWVGVWSQELGESAAEHFGDILAVADDCRFENEAAAIRAEGGIVVRIDRAGAGSATGASHASEAGVVPDVTIINDGTPEMLRARLFVAMDRHFNYKWREIPPVPDWVPLSSLAG